MEQVLEELRRLSLDDIRQQLIQRGEAVGPLMHSMKHLYEKKLARRILQERGIDNDEQDKIITNVDNSSSNRPATPDKVKFYQSDEFYAISLPKDIPSSNCNQLVFDNKKDAMSVLKKFPGSRFKKFQSADSAKAFTSIYAEDIVQSPRVEIKQVEKKEQRNFKEPNRADRINLKDAIEEGDLESVRRMIWSNPHYLISVGETPVALQEAFRYNSIHLAAKFNRADVCELILETVRDPEFHQMLYADDSDVTRTNRIKHLLDLYLNTPDKGSGDSALHFACKFGHADVVEVLVKYSQCDKNLRNKMGDKPKDVINQRASVQDMIVKDRIEKLLSGLVYIPLYRAIGNLPVIGEAVSEICSDDRTLKAYAGPMTSREAEKFSLAWSTFPPNSPIQKQKEIRETKRSDYDKGLERLGRQLADEYDVGWHEYWEFLNDFLNLKSPEGLERLEHYLAKRRKSLSEDLNGNDVHSRNKTPERCPRTESLIKEGSVICRDRADLVPQSPGDNLSPMTSLVKKFEKMKLNDSVKKNQTFRKSLDYSSDSDSESEFYSAPSSPSDLVTVETSFGFHNNTTGCYGDSSESEDEFEDADDSTLVVTPVLQSCGAEEHRPSVTSDEAVFLDGCVPTKLDLDVYRALRDVSVKESVYPHFARWRRAITSYSSKEQNQWPSPARVRRLNKPLPQSPLATPHKYTESLSKIKSKLEFE